MLRIILVVPHSDKIWCGVDVLNDILSRVVSGITSNKVTHIGYRVDDGKLTAMRLVYH